MNRTGLLLQNLLSKIRLNDSKVIGLRKSLRAALSECQLYVQAGFKLVINTWINGGKGAPLADWLRLYFEGLICLTIWSQILWNPSKQFWYYAFKQLIKLSVQLFYKDFAVFLLSNFVNVWFNLVFLGMLCRLCT